MPQAFVGLKTTVPMEESYSTSRPASPSPFGCARSGYQATNLSLSRRAQSWRRRRQSEGRVTVTRRTIAEQGWLEGHGKPGLVTARTSAVASQVGAPSSLGGNANRSICSPPRGGSVSAARDRCCGRRFVGKRGRGWVIECRERPLVCRVVVGRVIDLAHGRGGVNPPAAGIRRTGVRPRHAGPVVEDPQPGQLGAGRRLATDRGRGVGLPPGAARDGRLHVLGG